MGEKLLEGVKIVELATFIAAPAAVRFLADLGAEVIKIESPKGDTLRYTAASEGRPLNQYENTTFDLENANKRGIALNLRTEKGLEILYKLLDDADVFVTNWRPQALAKSGLDYDSLKERYPKLVYASCTGFGEKGPDKDLPGFDFTAFLARGGYLHTLHPQGSEPMLGIPALGDHNVAMNLAAGILAALYHAKMTGKGEKVSGSLFQTAVYNMAIMIQAEQYPDYGVQYPIDKRKADNPINNAFKTKDDRYIQLVAPNYDIYYEQYITAIDRADLVGDERYFPIKNLQEKGNGPELFDIFVEQFAKKDAKEWCEILAKADVPFGLAQSWGEILEDKQAWANDFFYKMHYDNGSEKVLVRPPVQFEEMGTAEYKRGPLLGENGPEILMELGYSEDEIKALRESKDVYVWGDPK